MVSKSFCTITCRYCGKESETRRDIYQDKGWERSVRIFECPHLAVDADIYTHNTQITCTRDEVRFVLYGKCKCHGNCKNFGCETSPVGDSRRTAFKRGFDQGRMYCDHCGSEYYWAVNHCSHALLQSQTYEQMGQIVDTIRRVFLRE